MPKSSTLTPKQEAFVSAYILSGNATAAARSAGYKGGARQLQVQGSVNLSQPIVRAAIEAHADGTRERTARTLDDHVDRLLHIADDEGAPYAARVAAILGSARLHGYVVDRSEARVAVDHVVRPLASFNESDLLRIVAAGREAEERQALIEGESRAL